MPLFVGASESYDTDAWEAYNLKKENAKLRELVREMYEDQCDECDRWRYRDRMHEIGIEAES